MPESVPGKARDFMLRVTASGDNVIAFASRIACSTLRTTWRRSGRCARSISDPERFTSDGITLRFSYGVGWIMSAICCVPRRHG